MYCSVVRFQVFMLASMKITVFWDVAPCSLVEVYRRFGGAYCLQLQGDVKAVGKLLPEYTAQHPRRQPSSMYNSVYFIVLATLFCVF
jgi:hypothetical protein